MKYNSILNIDFRRRLPLGISRCLLIVVLPSRSYYTSLYRIALHTSSAQSLQWQSMTQSPGEAIASLTSAETEARSALAVFKSAWGANRLKHGQAHNLLAQIYVKMTRYHIQAPRPFGHNAMSAIDASLSFVLHFCLSFKHFCSKVGELSKGCTTIILPTMLCLLYISGLLPKVVYFKWCIMMMEILSS